MPATRPAGNRNSSHQERQYQPVRNPATPHIVERGNRKNNNSGPPGDRMHARLFLPCMRGTYKGRAIVCPNPRRPANAWIQRFGLFPACGVCTVVYIRRLVVTRPIHSLPAWAEHRKASRRAAADKSRIGRDEALFQSVQSRKSEQKISAADDRCGYR